MLVRSFTLAILLGLLGLNSPAKANIVYDLTLTGTSGTQTPNPDTLVLTFDNSKNFISLAGSLDGDALAINNSNDGYTFNFVSNVLQSITGTSPTTGSPRLSFSFSGGIESYSYHEGNNGREISDGTVQIAAVPEPSTWAMMILGFAVISFLTYRRKSAGLRLAQ
jgi:hypothetical protein